MNLDLCLSSEGSSLKFTLTGLNPLGAGALCLRRAFLALLLILSPPPLSTSSPVTWLNLDSWVKSLILLQSSLPETITFLSNHSSFCIHTILDKLSFLKLSKSVLMLFLFWSYCCCWWIQEHSLAHFLWYNSALFFRYKVWNADKLIIIRIICMCASFRIMIQCLIDLISEKYPLHSLMHKLLVAVKNANQQI